MTKIKTLLGLVAAFTCGGLLATPGAFSTWFDNAVPSYGTQDSGWTGTATLANDVLTIDDWTDGVRYTPEETTTDYQKETITITAEPIDWADLPATNADVLDGAKFAVCVALPEGGDTPVFAALTSAGWVEVANVTPATGTDHTLTITYNKADNTFTLAKGALVSTSLIACGEAGNAIASTTILGSGSVSELSGETAGPAAASINGVGYDSLADAITAAAGESTIVLEAPGILPAYAGTHKIQTNGFALNTPSGYFATIDGVNVTVAATSGTAPDASMIWNRDFASGRVDANGNNWSFYTPSGVTRTSDGITMTSGGGVSIVNRTKNPTGLTGTMTVIFRAKNIALPTTTTGQAVLARLKQGSTTLGAAINADGYYTRVWTDSNLDWSTRRDKSVVVAPSDVEQTYVLTYEYAGNQTKGTYFYRVDGERTVTKLWQETGLQASGMSAIDEISILGKWNGNACIGATLTGLAVIEGTRLTEEGIANFNWTSLAPNKSSYDEDDPPYVHYGYIPSEATMIWPGLTLDDIKGLMFAGTMNGNWVAADANANDGSIAKWADVIPTVEKTVEENAVVLDFKAPNANKFVRVTLTEANGGIKAAAVAGTTKGGSNSELSTDDNTGNYGIKVLRATQPVAQIVDGADFATLAAAIEAAGTPTEESPVTIQLLQASSEAVTIPANVTVDVNGQTFTGTVAGAGKLQVAGFSAISSATNLKNSLKNEQWTGTLVVTQPASGGINEGAIGSGYSTALNEYGNADSKIEFLNCTYDNGDLNYFGLTTNDATIVQPEVIITGELKLRNGFSYDGSNGYKTIFRKVSGTGTILCPRGNLGPRLYFVDGSDFRGTINTQGYKFYFGAFDSSDPAPAAGAVIVKPEQTVTIAGGSAWTAAGGFTIDGTLKFIEQATTGDKVNRLNNGSLSGTGVIDLSEAKGQASKNLNIAFCGANHTFSGECNIPSGTYANIVFAPANAAVSAVNPMNFSDGGEYICVISNAKATVGTWTSRGVYLGANSTVSAAGGVINATLQVLALGGAKFAFETYTPLTINGTFNTYQTNTHKIQLPAADPAMAIKLIKWTSHGTSTKDTTFSLDPAKSDCVLTLADDGLSCGPSEAQIVPHEAGLVINVADATIEKDDGTTVAGSTIPNETGVYTVKKGETVVAEVAVIAQTPKETTTTLVAVPFEGLDGASVTAASLLNTKLLAEGDQLKVYDGAKYRLWTLTADKTWDAGKTVTAAGVVEADSAEDIALTRGKAVWVTTAAKIMTYGRKNADGVKPAVTSVVNLLGNTKMVATDLADIAVEGDEVEIPGDTSGVRTFKKTADGWSGVKTVFATDDEGNVVYIAGLPVKKTVSTDEAPSVPAGRGYFLKRQ